MLCSQGLNRDDISKIDGYLLGTFQKYSQTDSEVFKSFFIYFFFMRKGDGRGKMVEGVRGGEVGRRMDLVFMF